MQRKSPRGIPDFSRKATRPKDVSSTDAAGHDRAVDKARPTPPPAPPRTKPQGTSAKGGQRGK